MTNEKNTGFVSVSASLPTEVYEAMRKFAFDHRVSKSKVIAEAVAIFVRRPDLQPADGWTGGKRTSPKEPGQ